ncbi:hypothetical protein [Fibrella forsythiae]|uniref:DUF2029 domain-containing protein n=1 Tax=Fibrella forsythiae TaxID=2817061 RepID=A0ABS3JJV5_9BACT|nr:hypothetical protein [Fibrella forsythiae]MBO0950291.1 hypothetical protein [Fibrella forsythiae]
MTPENTYNSLYVQSGTVLLVLRIGLLLLGAWRWRLLTDELRIFWYYLLASFGSNLLEQGFIWSVNNQTDFWLPYLEKYKIGDTNFLSILPRLLDYIFLGPFYARLLTGQLANWIRWTSIALIFTAIGVYIWIDGFRSFGAVNALMNRVYLIVLPLLHLWLIYRSLPALSLWKNSYFLISLGLLTANIFSFYLSLFGHKLNETDGIRFLQLSLLRNAFVLISLGLYACAFYQVRYVRFITKTA